MPVAAQVVAGNVSLGRLEKGVFRLLCFAKEILLFKWLWKWFGNSLCVCMQQGAVAAHFNSQFRLCLGVALATPRIKGACVHNLLLGCSLQWWCLAQLSAISVHGQVCVRGTELEILRNCSLALPKPFEFLEDRLKKALKRDTDRNYLHLTPVSLMGSGTSGTCKPVLSFLAIIL